MKIGDLRYRITVQESDIGTDELGGKPKTFIDKFSCFAGVKFESGEETQRAERIEHNLSVKIKIRYREDITTFDRVVFDETVYQIKNIYPDALKTYIKLECENVVE